MAIQKINGENISDINRINKSNIDTFTKINDGLLDGVIRSNLVLWLDANNEDSYNGSGNIWYDMSSTGYNFTNNGATFTIANGARCWSFDGINDYMVGANTSRFGAGSNNSVGLWVNHASAPDLFDFIYGKEYTGEWDPFLDHREVDGGGSPNGLCYGSFKNFPQIAAFGTFAQTIPLNTWKYYTFTFQFNSSTSVSIRHYINGVYIGVRNKSFTQGYFPTTARMFLAALSVNGSAPQRYFNGRIGAIHTYEKVLSLDEINYNFNQNKATYGY